MNKIGKLIFIGLIFSLVLIIVSVFGIKDNRVTLTHNIEVESQDFKEKNPLFSIGNLGIAENSILADYILDLKKSDNLFSKILISVAFVGRLILLFVLTFALFYNMVNMYKKTSNSLKYSFLCVVLYVFSLVVVFCW